MLKLSKTSDAFLALIRLGIGHSVYQLPDEYDWTAIHALAIQHGLLAVVLDGIDKLPAEKRPPKEVLLQWIGEVRQNYEQRDERYRQAISELAGFYNAHGYKMMVLKGYACALDWPKPSHRPCGDIDIWLFGQQKDADAMLVKEKRVKIDSAHHHHTVFYWQKFVVENHYDFLNVYHHKSNVELEGLLKELGQDDSHFTELNGERVYLPSANLHALFLLRHSMSNFASTGMKLRQLLDWAFFAKKHGSEIDWNWLENELEHFGMKKLYDIFNAICVGSLGFDVGIFPKVQFNMDLKDRVWNDILSLEFAEKEKGGMLGRAFYKYRRWKANEWKHELCFSESMWSAFWSGMKSHLLKPSSI